MSEELKAAEGQESKETWADFVRGMWENHSALLGCLSVKEICQVLENAIDYIAECDKAGKEIPEKSQHALLKKFVRQTDSFVDWLYRKDIFARQNKRDEKVDVDKWFDEYVPRRRKKCLQRLLQGEKVRMHQMLDAVQHLTISQGPFIALSFFADHIDLVDTQLVDEDVNRSEKDWLGLGLKMADNMSAWCASAKKAPEPATVPQDEAAASA